MLSKRNINVINDFASRKAIIGVSKGVSKNLKLSQALILRDIVKWQCLQVPSPANKGLCFMA